MPNSIVPLMENFLNAETIEAQSAAYNILAESVKNGFNSEDKFYDKLVKYNLYKIVLLRYMKNQAQENKVITAKVANTEVGSIYFFPKGAERITQSGASFVQNAKERGMTVSEPVLSKTRKFNRVVYKINVSRPGYSHTQEVEFNANRATPTDVNSLIKSITDLKKSGPVS